MGEDPWSWIHRHNSTRLTHDLNPGCALIDLRKQDTVSTCMNPTSNTTASNRSFPMFSSSGPLQTKAGPSNAPHWLYCLPQFHQAFSPMLNSIPKERLPLSLDENLDGVKPTFGGGSAQKKFLVFDQSGDQTTLIYGSGQETPIHQLTSLNPRLSGVYKLKRDDPVMERDIIYSSQHVLPEYEESNGDHVSNVREDTEELDALLYSDDDDYDSHDGEETSTGHSPLALRPHDAQECSNERSDEFASFAGLRKRQKLSSGECVLPQLVDTSNLVKHNWCSAYEEDAESVCSDGNNRMIRREKSREEEIHEVMSILQSIIPGGKGKDATMVFDEALHYIGLLKLEAKALGLTP